MIVIATETESRDMRGVIVVADDLTGAADTGIRFAPVVGNMWLSPSFILKECILKERSPQVRADGAAIFTNSRHLDAARARRAVRDVFEKAELSRPGSGSGSEAGPERLRFVYKKIDSTLRGQVGAEVAELLGLTGKKVALIAPTSVEQGRTVEGGLLRLHGVPAAESEPGRDPIAPLTTSKIVDIVAGPEKLAVRLLDIATLSRGREALHALFDSWLSGPPCLVACEAVDRGHLRAIADLAMRPECLPAGSAGLAGEIVALLPSDRPSDKRGRKDADPPGGTPFAGRTLWLCGTASAVTRAQADCLADAAKMPAFTLSESETVDKKALFRWLQEPLRLMEPPDAQVLIRVGGARMSPTAILDTIRTIVRKFADGPHVDNFFLSGGDTAQAVLSELESYPLALEEEVLPGLIRSRDPRTRRNFFTKSGGFGEKDTLLRLHERFRASGQKMGFSGAAGP